MPPRAEQCDHLRQSATLAGSAPIFGALSCTGFDVVITVEGAIDMAVLQASVEQVPVLALEVVDIVAMNNFSVHEVSCVLEAIETAGGELYFLPPESSG